MKQILKCFTGTFCSAQTSYFSEKWAPHVYKKSPDYFCVTKLECSSRSSITKSMKHVSTADDDRAAALAKLRRAKENGELLHQTSRLPKPFAKNLLLLQGGNSSRREITVDGRLGFIVLIISKVHLILKSIVGSKTLE